MRTLRRWVHDSGTECHSQQICRSITAMQPSIKLDRVTITTSVAERREINEAAVRMTRWQRTKATMRGEG